MPERIYILAGAIQSGKTTKLKEWCNDKKDVFGILTPVIDGKRFFLDISTKENFQMEAESNEKNVFLIGKFVFSKKAFEKTIGILTKAMKEKEGWLIVDEIGPLELKGEGFAEALKKILANKNSFKLLIVVRENLIQQVIGYFKIDEDKIEILKTDSEFFNG